MEFLEEKAYCRECGGERNHLILEKVVKEVDLYNPRLLRLCYTDIYAIIECAGCENISFIRIKDKALLEDEDGSKQTLKLENEVYPPKPKIVHPYKLKFSIEYSNDIPDNIQKLLLQIVDAYNNLSNTLSALGLRTIIEAICLELDIKKGFKYDIDGKPLTHEGKKESIEGRIFGLYEKKYITWYHALILQKIREIGNAATHEFVTPTSHEVYDAIEIVEKLIEDVFTLKGHSLLESKRI